MSGLACRAVGVGVSYASRAKNCQLLLLAIFGLASWSSGSWAAGELHLSFHMGGAGGGQAFVGGTLVNSGDEPVVHGYIVVTLLDAQCHPLSSLLESFGPIAAGQQLGFRVPVEGRLERYRLTNVKAFDTAGFELPAVDDNAALLAAREPEARAFCAQAQDAASD